MNRQQTGKPRQSQRPAQSAPPIQAATRFAWARKHLLTAPACLFLTGTAFAVTYLLVRAKPPRPPAPEGMAWIPGGEFTMGTDDERGWADERPAHRVRVGG